MSELEAECATVPLVKRVQHGRGAWRMGGITEARKTISDTGGVS